MEDPEKFDFSMAQGEFINVFGSGSNKWDCIVTCFFIDTAHNVLDYMQTFNKILKVGGLWVNIGPLHWHYSEQPYEVQVQISLEEIEHLVPKFGFRFRKKYMKETSYTGRLNCMHNMKYESVFFSAVKVSEFEPPSQAPPQWLWYNFSKTKVNTDMLHTEIKHIILDFCFNP